MLHNILVKILKDCKISQVRHSALFINGAKATEQFVYVTPYINTSELLEQKNEIQKELSIRKSHTNFSKIENLLSVYAELKNQKASYELKKSEISKELAIHVKTNPESDETKKFKIQMNLIKENIKKLKVPLWSAEEAAMIEILKLPNKLNARTPENNKHILYSHLSPPKCKKNHLEIGKNLDIIKLKKNENYYFTGDAAIFELGAKFYLNKILRENNFIQFSNADFVKSLIVEGCGIDHTNPDRSFILHHNEDSIVNKDSRLHLTGGGSLCSFLAYHTKNVIFPKVLPLKYFTMGRQYVPSEDDCLFRVSQSSVVEVFGATKTTADLDTMLDEVTSILKNIYIDIGYHFRLCIVPADKLQMWESLRVSVEMFSTSLDCYIEVGNISLSGDFISKRLLFTYVENKENKFPHLLSGTILNVPKLLGCIMEQDQEFVVPELFKVEKWSL